MGDGLPGFRLRELTPDEGPAIGRLFDASPDSVVIATFDSRGPLGAMIAAPRWVPRTAFTRAVRAPRELRPDHPIDLVQ